MSYGQTGYGEYPQRTHQYQHQDPFNEPSPYDYPPNSNPNARPYSGESQGGASQWSLDEEPKPLTGRGAAAAGYNPVLRDSSNPYSKEYRSGNETSAGNKVRKWIWIVAAVIIVIAIVVGIVAWRVVAGKNDGSSSSGKGKLQYISGTAKVVKSNPSDPSQFEKDPRLKQVFYGMAYTPFNALEPWCGATLNNVTEDMQLLSQLTTRIRTYGSACNQSELVLQAIQDTKVNMTVWLGAYIGDNTTVNAQQQDWIVDALDKYGVDHVGGITIGNEYVLNAVSPADTTTRISYLTDQMSAFRTRIAAKGYSKTIPVGVADAGSVFTTTFASGADYIMANVHPWFGGVPIEQAAGWTWDFFEQNDVTVAQAAANKPTAYIAETGWPTASMTPENATYEGAVAGVSQLQTFLDTYVCQANQNGSYYFYFEPFDEPWKEQFGGVEPYWGAFDHNRRLKDITFPDCAIDSAHASG
ncbi:uncharacterized protein JCM15063_000427 [Sporobolomyces koalae]|uniref:uncharacterized protein n=1 Tax=Sporobolomyces koalae TaxID=500713 RepID=UPI0031768344